MNTTAVHIDTQLYNSAAEYARRQHTSVDKMLEAYITAMLLQTMTTEQNTGNSKNRKKTGLQERLCERLEEMRQLEYDWDDEGAPPINEEIIGTVAALVDEEGGRNMEHWIIFPDTNGTLMLEAKHQDATISIGKKEFSYVFHSQEHDESASHLPLSIDTLMQIIKHINEQQG
ncbi:MAG: hypothetical protein IJT53_07820 [Prevotella sp.]|nr:hypothetical protein [Prevotella sp.]